MSTKGYISDKAASKQFNRKTATLQLYVKKGLLQAWTVNEHLEAVPKREPYGTTYYKIADLEHLIKQRKVEPKAAGEYPVWLVTRIEEIGALLQETYGCVTRTDIVRCLNADPVYGYNSEYADPLYSYKTPYYLAWQPNRARVSRIRKRAQVEENVTHILIKSSATGKFVPTPLNEEELRLWTQHAQFVLEQLARTMATSIEDEEIQRLGAEQGMQIETSTISTVRCKTDTRYNQPREWPIIREIADAHPEWLPDPRALIWQGKEA